MKQVSSRSFKMSGNQNGVNNIDNATTSVVIVGAGPVGMLLALKLGKANIDVTVIEKESTTAEDPRAIGYYAASALALLDAGVYHKILDEGFTMKGLCWRKKPVDDGKGGKRLGDVIAAMPLADLDDDVMPPGTGMLCLQQALLTRLLVREALSTGHVMLLFNRALCDIEEGDETVTAITRDTETGDMHKIVASFLVGTDGGRSTTRELLKIPFPGHTWPERLLATNVMVPNIVDPTFPCHFVLDPINYTITTPLTPLVLGETTLWRCTMATDPKDTRSDEEMLKDEHIASLYEKVMAGPRPLKYEIKQRSMYRIHQRLAPTLRRGRSVLAGDAAHVCNVSGLSRASVLPEPMSSGMRII